MVAQVRALVKPLPPRPVAADDRQKNPPAIFVLTTPRSGSTLFRVMLAGHPALFAPPEPDLLLFNSLAERKAGLSGAEHFRSDGIIRAIMELKSCEVEAARAIVEDFVAQGLTIKQFYKIIQGWVAPRRLVDKTTFYALDSEALNRMEVDFDNAVYLHLIRHPYGMIHSFEKARLDRLFFKDQHPYSIRQIAEITWLICQQNILQFLARIPAQRQYQIKFEALVRQPQPTIQALCQFLGLAPHPAMMQPYQDKTARMTDGIHSGPASRMLGDVKFHEHDHIVPEVADTWKDQLDIDFLADMTAQLAASLGYDTGRPGLALEPIQRLSRTAGPAEAADEPLDLLAHLTEEEIAALLADNLD
jgi:hypothetical protein